MSTSVFSTSTEKPYRVQKLDKIDAWFEFKSTETVFVVDLKTGPVHFHIDGPQAMARAINNLWVVSLDKNQGCLRHEPARLAKTLLAAVTAYEQECTLIDPDLFEQELLNSWKVLES